MISVEKLKSIGEFYFAEDCLRELKAIRSDRYIAEFMANECLGMTLVTSCRARGHDGQIGDKKLRLSLTAVKILL